MTFVQGAMLCAGLCYAAAAIGYSFEGKLWMAVTTGLYMCSIGTIYMAGR